MQTIYENTKQFTQQMKPADPWSTCRLATHAGELPNRVCEIIERLEQSKPKPVITRNAYLFYGPPGTGKTTLVHAITAESDSFLIDIAAPALVTSYQGSGAEHILKAFKMLDETLEKNPEKTVVFFVDEIDAIAKNRGETGTYTDLSNTFLTLQLYIDKYRDNPRVVFILASNKKDILDDSLLSRLVRVEMPRPNQVTTTAIFLRYLKDHAADLGDELYHYARKLHEAELSARNIKNIVEEVIWQAKRRRQETIDKKLLDKQIETEIIMSREEKKIREKEENDKALQRKLTESQIEHHEYEKNLRELQLQILKLQLDSLKWASKTKIINSVTNFLGTAISTTSHSIGIWKEIEERKAKKK